MVTVTFLASLQEYQEERMREMAERLRADHPDWTAEVLSPEESKPVLSKYKLQFGPAIVVDGRVEFVGIPRYRMLVERVAMIAAGRPSPRSAQPPASTAAVRPTPGPTAELPSPPSG